MEKEFSLFRNFDLLSADCRYSINWIPSATNPGVLSFLMAIARAYALSVLCIAALYPIYKGQATYSFGAAEVSLFTFIFVIFEEQARWVYASRAATPAAANAKFAILIIVIESIGFGLGSKGQLSDFAAVRAGSMIVHVINAILCTYSLTSRAHFKRYGLFALAVLAHLFMNLAGSARLFDWLK